VFDDDFSMSIGSNYHLEPSLKSTLSFWKFLSGLIFMENTFKKITLLTINAYLLAQGNELAIAELEFAKNILKV
jgi:hypothetical protein